MSMRKACWPALGLVRIDLSKDPPVDAAARTSKARGISTLIRTFTKDKKSRRSAQAAKDRPFRAAGRPRMFSRGLADPDRRPARSLDGGAELDGFNLQRSGEPDDLTDFVDLVVPELQNRGVYKPAYRDGTFRQKLFAKGDRLPGESIPLPGTGRRPSFIRRRRRVTTSRIANGAKRGPS